MATTSELSAAISAACLASARAKRARAEHERAIAELTAAGFGHLLDSVRVRKAALRAALAITSPKASADALIQRLYRERRAALGPTSTIFQAMRAWGRPVIAKVTI